jgi:hypothetical protein
MYSRESQCGCACNLTNYVYPLVSSPIRRYADVVVHKQLLATTSGADRVPWTGTQAAERGLGTLPGSDTISLLSGGKALQAIQLGRGDPSRSVPDLVSNVAPNEPYPMAAVMRICERLNLQNRLAKLSSAECQKLFLSLYFRDHSEVTQAVVVSLRQNGLWLYVPKFDLRSSLYLCDRSGALHADPRIFNLPPLSGIRPDDSFTSAPGNRRFPNGSCRLVDEKGTENQRLEVFPFGTGTTPTLVFRALDVVTIRLSCDSWDARARIPSPRIHLVLGAAIPVSNDKTRPAEHVGGKITSKHVASRESHPVADQDLSEQLASMDLTCPAKLVALARVTNTPVMISPTKSEQIPGRRVYNEFVNEDTRSYRQRTLQEAVQGSQGRAHEAAANRQEYSTALALEKSSMARQQRLAATKRQSRRHAN